jgi:hypothetical protein
MTAPAIILQIKKIGEHIRSKSFSTSSLAELRDAILDAHDVVQFEISERERALRNPVRALLTGDPPFKPRSKFEGPTAVASPDDGDTAA